MVLDSGYLVSQLINGFVLSSILILVSLGLSIIFGMLGVINFAHGEFLTLGAYLTWFFATLQGNVFVSLTIAVTLTILIGMIIERFAIRFSYDYNPIMTIILTIGLSYLLRSGIIIIWGRTGKNMSIPGFLDGSIEFSTFTLSEYRLFIFSSAIIILIAMKFASDKTNIGLIIRASLENREMTNVLGVNVNRIYTLIFGFGAGLAGLAGGLLVPIQGASPIMGLQYLIMAFVVVVIGGAGNIRGTILSGLIIGMTLSLARGYMSVAAPEIIFILMIVILLIKPKGILGEAVYS